MRGETSSTVGGLGGRAGAGVAVESNGAVQQWRGVLAEKTVAAFRHCLRALYRSVLALPQIWTSLPVQKPTSLPDFEPTVAYR